MTTRKIIRQGSGKFVCYHFRFRITEAKVRGNRQRVPEVQEISIEQHITKRVNNS